MKKLLFIFVFVTVFWAVGSAHAFAAGCTGTGSCYWVGGTGNWNDTTHWATTSGGSTTGGLPSSTDNVHFNASSNATAYTVTVNAVASTKDFDVDAEPTSGVVTIAGTSAMSVFGNFTLLSGMSYTESGQISFSSGSAGQTITTAGNTLNSTSGIRFVGAGSWQLQDNLRLNVSGALSLLTGTLDTNNKTLTIGSFTASSGTTLTAGSSTFNITNTGWTAVAGMSGTLTGTTISMSGLSNAAFAGGGLSYGTVSDTTFQNAAGITGANTFINLTISNTSNTNNLLHITGNQNITGTLTITGNSVVNRILLESTTLGTNVTLTAAAVTMSNVDFQDITGAGAATWAGTTIGDAQGNSGITFTTPVTRYWVGNGGNYSDTTHWSTSSGGAGGATAPLPQDTVNFDANSVTSTGQFITINIPRLGTTINMTGLLHAPTFSASAFGDSYIFGSLTGTSASAPIYANSGSSSFLHFEGRTSQTLTANSLTFQGNLDISMPGATLSLGSDLNIPGSGFANELSLSSGGLNANGFNVTTGTMQSNTSVSRTLTLGSGTWTCTAAASTWSLNSPGLTVVPGTSLIKFTDTTSSSKTFAGGGNVYNNLWFAPGSGTGSFIFVNSDTFNDLKDDGTAAHSILFAAGKTESVRSWHVSGTPGNLITLTSNSSTAINDLVLLGGGVISADYLNIQHSVATPGISWYAGANSTNNQATATAGSGWIFTVPPGGPITDTILTSNFENITATNSLTTASISPSVGSVVVFTDYLRFNNTASTTLSGDGLTWRWVNGIENASNGAWTETWVGTGTPSPGPLTLTCGGGTNCVGTTFWTATQWTGIDTVSPVVQSAVGNGLSTNATLTVNYPNTFLSGDAGYSAWFYTGGGGSGTPRSGWSEIDDHSINGNSWTESQSIFSADTAGAVTNDIGVGENPSGMVLELRKASAPAAVPGPTSRIQLFGKLILNGARMLF